jgi:hypothetical protein
VPGMSAAVTLVVVVIVVLPLLPLMPLRHRVASSRPTVAAPAYAKYGNPALHLPCSERLRKRIEGPIAHIHLRREDAARELPVRQVVLRTSIRRAGTVFQMGGFLTLHAIPLHATH